MLMAIVSTYIVTFTWLIEKVIYNVTLDRIPLDMIQYFQYLNQLIVN